MLRCRSAEVDGAAAVDRSHLVHILAIEHVEGVESQIELGVFGEAEGTRKTKIDTVQFIAAVGIAR